MQINTDKFYEGILPLDKQILGPMAARAANLRQPNQAIGIEMTQRSIPNQFRRGGIPPWPRSKKAVGRTLIGRGRYKGAWRFRASKETLEVFTDLIYARAHQEGLTIRPRKAKFLAIPLRKQAQGRSPREFENTFIRKGIIFQDRGRSSAGRKLKPLALYVLKKKVKMPKRRVDFTPGDINRARLILFNWIRRGKVGIAR